MALDDPNYDNESPGGSGAATHARALTAFVSGIYGMNPSVSSYSNASANQPNTAGVLFDRVPEKRMLPGDVRQVDMGRDVSTSFVGVPQYNKAAGAGPARTIDEAMAKLHNLPEDQMVAWKNAVYESGLYDPSVYSKKQKPRQVGVMDDEDLDAFQRLMLISVRAPEGTTVQDILSKMKKDNPNSAENNYGEKKAAVAYQVADPATVRNYAKTAAQTLLGRDLDDVEMADIVQKMISQDRGAARAGAQAQSAASDAGQGGTVETQAVDIGSRTAEEVERENPAEVMAKKVANGYDIFMKMMMGQ